MTRNLRRRITRYGTILSLLVVATVAGRQLYVNRPGYGLPFQADFGRNSKDRWTAHSGTWEVVDGAMRNDSNDRGAKLVTGSPNWRDYVVEADLQLLGTGSVGVLARVSEAEPGENSFKGYFAGIRTVDNSLVLGAYDFSYHEAAKTTLPDLVRPLRWYHVRLKVDGCKVTATAWADGMPVVATAPVSDPECFRSGSIGLRTNGTGGVWRNVRAFSIPTAEPNDFAGVPRDKELPPSTGSRPSRGSDVARKSIPLLPVRSLLYLPPVGSPVATIRGSVVLTRPTVFVQDPTGGVEVQATQLPVLKIGDEVEVSGEVNLDQSSPVIRNAEFRLLKEAEPIPPAVVTANQIADGYYDGRIVQVEGYLRRVFPGENGTQLLDLDAGAQSFRAILPAGRSDSHREHLALESRLMLRGISVVDPRFNQAANPFAILVRSAEDIDVVAGPPWWRPSTLIAASLIGLALIFAINHLYFLARHWRFRAVADERERLAHEIHDTLAQSFAGIAFQLQAIRNSLPSGAAALESQVDLAMSMARTSHGEARHSIASLRPESLKHIGLLPALRDSAERMVRNGNVRVETDGEESSPGVPPRINDALYRIGLEAIANAIRHADPRTIRIRLQRTRSTISLSVEDDGGGFVETTEHTGFGLLGMRKRAESVSAALTVRSTPGAGTRIEVKAPVGSRFLLGLFAVPRALR